MGLLGLQLLSLVYNSIYVLLALIYIYKWTELHSVN